MKKKAAKKKRLTSAERKSRDEAIAAEKEFAAKKKVHDDKVAEVQKEAQELESMRRAQIMRVVTGLNFSTAELDVFVAVCTNMADKQDVSALLIRHAVECGKDINMDNFQTKLVRMGLL